MQRIGSQLALTFKLLITGLLGAASGSLHAAAYCPFSCPDGHVPLIETACANPDGRPECTLEARCQKACDDRLRANSQNTAPTTYGTGNAGGSSTAQALELLGTIGAALEAQSRQSELAARQQAWEQAQAAERERQEEARRQAEARAEAQRAHQAQVQADALIAAASRDASLNLWAGAKEEPTENRVALLAVDCIEVEVPGPKAGVTHNLYSRWTNRCGVPVEVLYCFEDDTEQRCRHPENTVGWGVTSRIQPGATVVAAGPPDTRRIWSARYHVCDMTRTDLCVYPKP